MSESRETSSGWHDSSGFDSERSDGPTPRIKSFASNRSGHAIRQTTGLEASQLHNFINQISPAAVVQVLLNKGIVTLEELEQAELQLHELQKQFRPELYSESRITYPPEAFDRKQKGYRSHRSSTRGWLKMYIARFRWSRRLGTLLFGWKWKRISKGTD